MAAAFRPAVKDIRALAPVFLGSLAAMALESVVWRYRALTIPTYLAGASTIGALAIGHEYGNGTLAQLLSQPARRSRMLMTKLAIVAAMVAVLGAVFWLAMSRTGPNDAAPIAAVVLPFLGALCLAPWLTMACRSSIAGAIFMSALPAWLWLMIQAAYFIVYRRSAPNDFDLSVMWSGALGLGAIGSIMTWRTFMRIEAVDGPATVVRMPTFGRAIALAARTQPRIWLLVKKDLHLQQMTFAITVLYVAAWLPSVGIGGRVLEVFSLLSVFFPSRSRCLPARCRARKSGS